MLARNWILASLGTISALATLGAGLVKAAADKKPLYACAETFTEAVTLADGLALYGGLDCQKGWAAGGPKTTLTADPDAIPLTIASSAGGASIADFAIHAAS